MTDITLTLTDDDLNALASEGNIPSITDKQSSDDYTVLKTGYAAKLLLAHIAGISKRVSENAAFDAALAAAVAQAANKPKSTSNAPEVAEVESQPVGVKI